MAKRRKQRRRRRRKNPGLEPLDLRTALALALVGAGIGGGSAALAGRRGAFARTSIGASVGAAIGAVMGALLPKGRSSNPEGEQNPLSMNPMKNPIGAMTAIAAGAVLAVIPAAIAIEAAAQKIPAPQVTGTYGVRKLHVVRKGRNWAWVSEDLGGAGISRREALEDVLGELAPLAGPADHVELHFERPTITISVAPLLGAPGWSWALSTGETGTAASRGAALIAAMDLVDDFGQPI